jgi:Flp pilus assembly protein TadD
MRTRGLLGLALAGLLLGGAGPGQAKSDEAIKRNNVGTALLAQGQIEAAIAEFRRAVEVDPQYAAAYRNLGYALDQHGQLEAAVAAYRQALALEPQVTAHNNLGVLYDRQGQYAQAIQEFERALTLDPGNATVQQNLANAQRSQGLRQERTARIAEAQQAVAARPQDPRAAYSLARVYASFDETDQAFAWLDKALQLGFDDLPFVRTDPVLAGLRTDPRFPRLLEGR